MTSNQDGVLAALKSLPNKGGMSEIALSLAEAQAKDYGMIINDNKKIREEVAKIREEQAKQSGAINSLDEKVELVLSHLKNSKMYEGEMFKANLEFKKSVMSNPMFYITIILIILCLAALVGINVAEFKDIVSVRGVVQ